MSAANIRLGNKASNLSSVARKVLDAVPVGEAWTVQFIYQELARQGHNIEVRIIGGCLDDLFGGGLIRQPQTGRYQRIAYKQPLPVVRPIRDAIEDDMAHASDMALPKLDPLSALGRLSAELRHIADQIDEQALAMAEEAQRANAGNEKLQQLQALLKSIGTA
jgi:hypothetical protein